MNKVYQLIWSKAKERWIAASEKIATRSGPAAIVGALALAAFLALAGPVSALDPGTLPTGGTITAGSGNIATSGSQMTVNQSTQQMIANWNTFNIGQNAGVRFNQPNSTAVALNHIFDQNPSQILGSLSANGKVFLLNPSGIVFGQNARVDVGGLVASSLNMLDSDFLAGKYKFTNNGSAGSIVNQGIINAMPGGIVALIAPKVTNEGTITANSGSVVLAAGNQVSLDFQGDGLISYTVDQGAIDALAENKGLIKADGGLVVMTAKAADSLTKAVVNNEGVIEAQTLQNKNGRIMLMSDMENGETIVSGKLDASAPNGGDGGFIETSANKVTIANSAKITTAAAQGLTGTWLIDPTDFTIAAGSGAQTTSGIGATTLQTSLTGTNMTITTAAAGTEAGDINVNSAVTWSANTLSLQAHNDININAVMTASGAASLDLEPGSGNVKVGMIPDAGGFKGQVNFSGTGTLTMNTNIYTVINDVGDLQGINDSLSGYYALGSNIDASTIGNFTSIGIGIYEDPEGEGDYEMQDSSTPFTGIFDGLGHTVTDLTINRPAEAISQGLFGYTSGATLRNVGVIGADITGGAYAVGGLVGYNDGGTINNSSAAGTITGSQAVGGLVGFNSGGRIDSSYATSTVVGGDSVGGLVGCNYGGSIDNSYATGTVNSEVTVGGLAGANLGSITNSYATGTVNSSHVSISYAGGLVGFNLGSITDAYATGEVTGTSNVGGLVGISDGAITDSYATGAVMGTSYVGGLVGRQNMGAFGTPNGSIDNSYATGTVNGTGDESAYIGGLVGQNGYFNEEDPGESLDGGSITNSYATGAVTGPYDYIEDEYVGGNYVGGLVGMNYGATSTITNAYATGAVIGGAANVGGLVGINGYFNLEVPGEFYDGGSITNSYATGTVQGADTSVGGLAGMNIGSITDSYATGTASSGGTLGGLVGINVGSITNAYATGDVTATGFTLAGGLAGINSGTISNSYATGAVTGAYNIVGGLVGLNNSSITDSYATGDVTGNDYVGGLVGAQNEDLEQGLTLNGSIENAYAAGAVNGTGDEPAYIGGLVGQNNNGDNDILGPIIASFWDKTVNLAAALDNGFGIGKTTDYMQTADTFTTAGWLSADWNFTTDEDNPIYPTLKVFTPAPNVFSVTIDNLWTTAGNWDAGHVPTIFETAVIGGNSIDIPSIVMAKNVTTTTGTILTFTGTTVSSLAIGQNGTVTLVTTLNYGTSGKLNLTGSGTDGAPLYLSLNGIDYTVIQKLGEEGDELATDNYTLQGLANSERVGGNYVLGLDIDASTTSAWDAYGPDPETYAGFTPIGTFTGVLDGLGHSVNNLTISRPDAENQGLFGYTSDAAALRNVGLIIASITGEAYVGGLVGFNYGSISNSYATGDVSASDSYVGGLVGFNYGSISNSYTTVKVDGSSYVGGLVGNNYGEDGITDSYATGDVSASDSYVGGLVGYNINGTIENSYATGTVSGGEYGQNVGGLVGKNGDADITDSYATGAVMGYGNVGGLVGYNEYGSITDSYATGTVSGDYGIGGLVGSNYGGITNSYATGAVSGNEDYVGGLVGFNYGWQDGEDNYGSISNAHATGAVMGYGTVGGLIGGNDSGTITGSHATGSVTGTGDRVGGLIGANGQNPDDGDTYDGGDIINSYATGAVQGASYVGGLVGSNSAASITDSYSRGSVNATGTDVGGLVGDNDLNGFMVGTADITNSYYNIDTVLINGARHVTLYGLYDDQYTHWLTDSKSLTISDYFTQSGGYYEISTTQGLKDLLGFASIIDSGYKFCLTANLDLVDIKDASLSTSDWNIPQFSASEFNGGGHTLANLNIDQQFSGFASFIGIMTSASTLKNIGLTNVSVINGGVAGGLVAVNLNGSISDSYAAGTVSGVWAAGGLVGLNISLDGLRGSITNSYATGVVTGNYGIGGLVGMNHGGTITNAYATGLVNDGFAGEDIGGLVGSDAGGTITNSFWDKQTTGQAHSSGSLDSYGKTTADMMKLSTFKTPSTTSDWDISATGGEVKVWRIYEGDSYPLLRSFLTPLTIEEGAVYGMNHLYHTTTGDNAFINVGTYDPADIYSDQQGYDITFADITMDITPAPLTITGTVANDKVYDGGTLATLSNIGTLTGLVGTEALTLTGPAAADINFNDKDVLDANLVTGTGYSIADGVGGVASNYALTSATSTAAASITAKGVTVTGITAADKVFDATTDAIINGGSYTGLIGGDLLNLTGAGAFSDKNLGSGKTVTAMADQLALAGTDAGNYTISNPGTDTFTTTADITTPAPSSQLGAPVQVQQLSPSSIIPGTVPPPSLFDTGETSEGVTVGLVNPPTGGAPGVIVATIPDNLAQPGSGFRFALPESVANAAVANPGAVTVTLQDGSSLPAWLQYDPDSNSFVANNVPEGFLPINVMVTIGGQSWIVQITEQQIV